MNTKENGKNTHQGEDKSWVKSKMDTLVPGMTPTASIARTRLESLIDKKESTMWQKIFGKQYRPAWVTAVIIGVLAISLSFPQVRAIATSFLGLFRVERMEAVDVGISLENLPQEMENRFLAADNIIGDQLIVDEKVVPIEVNDIDEASALAGFQARMPAYPDGETQIHFQKATAVRLVIDHEKWQDLLNSMNYKDLVIPKSADGAEVIFNIPAAVIVGIGDCEYNEINEVKLAHPATENCTVFLQSHTPTIEAPPGVDINKAGQVLLQILGMSETEAEEFSATVNWATTLVVPIPSDVDYQPLTIEGVDGFFLEDNYATGKSAYTLLWLKDGLFHALIGDGTLEEALKAVNSLE